MPNRAVVQAARIAAIRTGPSAYRLPPVYKSLVLTFCQLNANGHMGPRKFAKLDLPRIAYHNPSLDIKVTRVKNPEDKKNTQTSASLKLIKDNGEEVDVEVQHAHSDEITKRVKEVTGATLVLEETKSVAGESARP